MAIEEAGDTVVDEVSDRENLLISCTHNNPDIVLMDLHLSDIQRIRLVEDLLDINPDLAVVVISDPTEELGETMLAVGARAYIEKPFSMYDLIDLVKKVTPFYR
jgi:DNA-binding NarL/FixJ family response regulator